MNKIKSLIKLSILCILLFQTLQQAKSQDATTLLFENNGEIYFTFDLESAGKLNDLSKIISIDNVKGSQVFAYANKYTFPEFLGKGIPFTLLKHPGQIENPNMLDKVDPKSILDWDFYPTYQAYLDMMNQFKTDYPGLCEIVNIGTSIEGRLLLAARISDNITQDEAEPQVLFSSSIHGDELTGYVLMLRLINYLLDNYGTDPRITNMVDNIDIWICPLANPDGTYAGGNNTVNGATRENANYVDMNRNYPDPQDGPHPDGNEWQPETVAFMQLAEDNNFTLGFNIHGGAEVCNYPWDTWATLHTDTDWWEFVCREYADTVHVNAVPGYLTDLDNGVTNGYAWYSIDGGRQDYMTYFHQGREFTLEISGVKLPNASQLPAFWNYNYRSFLNYLEQSLYGIQGIVTDSVTGEPLEAEIRILNHEADSSWTYSHLPHGDYYRYVYEGTYDIEVTAYGYYPKTFENVVVQNRQLTTLDVELVQGNLIADFVASDTHINNGESISFTDLTFGNPTSWSWTFEGGNPSSSALQNPSGINYSQNGTYDVILTVSDGTNTTTVTKEDYITVSTDFLMTNGTVTTCSGIFYDSGGEGGEYNDDENFTLTFTPATSENKIKVEFTSFDVEYDNNCDYDYLNIYNGPSTSSPLLGTFCGTALPGPFTSTHSSGSLTFRFVSDYSVTGSGWEAVISCIPPALPPVADFSANPLTVDQGGSVQFTDLSQNSPDAWIWEFEGGIPSGSSSQNPSVTYNTPGTYNVTLTATNSYGNNSITKTDYITVIPTTGMANPSNDLVKVYPNPANNFVTLQSTFVPEEIRIIDQLGNLIRIVKPADTKSIVSLNNIPTGVYSISIQNGNQALNYRLVVIR